MHRRALLTVTGALVALCVAPPVHASAAPSDGTTVKTLPAVPGFAFTFHGTTYRTGRDGTVQVPGLAPDHGAELSSAEPITRLVDGSQFAFHRFYDAHEVSGGTVTAAMVSSEEVTVRFTDLSHAALPRTALSGVELTSSDGQVVPVADGTDSIVVPTREVVLRGHALAVVDVTYHLTRATADGRPVPASGPSSFSPVSHDTLTFGVPLESTTVHVRDALLGFSLGTPLHLTPPSGGAQTRELGDGGRLVLTGLPPGTYRFSADGALARASRTAILPRTRTVDLAVVTWVDLLVLAVAGVLLGPGIAAAVRRFPRVQRPAGAARPTPVLRPAVSPLVEPYPSRTPPAEVPRALTVLPTQVHGPVVIRMDAPQSAVSHEHPTLNPLPKMPV